MAMKPMDIGRDTIAAELPLYYDRMIPWHEVLKSSKMQALRPHRQAPRLGKMIPHMQVCTGKIFVCLHVHGVIVQHKPGLYSQHVSTVT